MDSCLLVCVSARVSGQRMWTVGCVSRALCALHVCMCVRALGWAWLGAGGLAVGAGVSDLGGRDLCVSGLLFRECACGFGPSLVTE